MFVYKCKNAGNYRLPANIEDLFAEFRRLSPVCSPRIFLRWIISGIFSNNFGWHFWAGSGHRPGMKPTPFLALLALLVATVAASAQSRFEVLRVFVHQPTNIVGEAWLDVGTNAVCRVTDFRRTWPNAFLGTTYPGGMRIATTNAVQVVGPCRVELFSTAFTAEHQEACATLELFPNGASPVQRTAVAPAGWPVAVQLESSTDLATWQVATNGAWPAADVHRFFRVSLLPTVATNAP